MPRAARRTNRRPPATTWGGARAGAGRPARHAIASEPHKTRPALSPRHPVHVTARVLGAVHGLRRRRVHAALRRAIGISLARADFRIVRLAIRSARLELLVEADDKTALARGMQGFQVAAARALNTALGRRGTVFPDRYRATILRTRRAVRASLAALTPRAGASREVAGATGTRVADAAAPCSPQTWLLTRELGRVRPRPRRPA